MKKNYSLKLEAAKLPPKLWNSVTKIFSSVLKRWCENLVFVYKWVILDKNNKNSDVNTLYYTGKLRKQNGAFILKDHI